MNLAAPSPAPLDTAASFVHGYPFEAWLADRGRATPAEAAALVASLATQLEAARAVGVAPGRAVPALVRIDATGSPRLDAWAATQRASAAEDTHAARMRFGPPPGETLDERSDVYVLGVVLYHLLTGRFPYPGSNPVELALAHRHHDVEPPSRLVPGLAEGLDALTLACLAKQPSARPASLALLADKLTGKLPEPLEVPAPPADRTPPLPEVRSATLRSAAPSPGLVTPRGSARVSAGYVLLAVGVAAAAAAAGFALASRSPVIQPNRIASIPPASTAATATTPTAPAVATPVPTPTATIPVPAAANASEPLPPSTAPAAAPPSEPAPTRMRSQPAAARPHTPATRPSPPAATIPAAPTLARPQPPEPAVNDTARVGLDHDADVMRLLAEGDGLLRQKKYLGGTEAGALDRYRAVLALAPAHAEANAKVHLIRTTYLGLARERRDGGDFDAAHRYLSGLERAFPGDDEVTRELLAVDAARAEASRNGELAIDVRPWGNVFVDGKFVDQTPMPPLALGAGPHRIEVEGEHGRRKSVDVTVRGGERQRVTVDLVRIDG